MISFLGEGAGTALDDIDYDGIYKVDAGASGHLYRQCRRYLGPLLPQGLSSYLEIGAGTGLFTLAYISEARPKRAIITDVSAKMLQVCRQRVDTPSIHAQTELSFVLWDGTTKCFADDVFDLVTGFSVLHHILDYGSVLAVLRDTLSVDGRAVFLEPSLAFHRAIIGFMTDVIGAMPFVTDVWTEKDRSVVACWIGENYINTKFHGDDLALELREDKHLFDIQSLRSAAATAGFGRVHVIPFGDDQEAWTSIEVYVNQLPLPPAARGFLLENCARMMPGPFAYLAPEERAPSFLIVLERGQSTMVEAEDHPSADVSFRHPLPAFRYALDVSLGRTGMDGRLLATAAGWILGDTDIRYVQLERGDSARFPVARIRVDVEAHMNLDRRYPLQRALCCGLMKVRNQYVDGSSTDPLIITVVTMAGERYELGRIAAGDHFAHFESLQAHTLPRLRAAELPESTDTSHW